MTRIGATILMMLGVAAAMGCSRSERRVDSKPGGRIQDGPTNDSVLQSQATNPVRTESLIEITDHRLYLDGQRIGDLEWSPKWGFWDFPESLWTGFAIKPLVEALERPSPHQGVKVKLRLPGETPYAVLDPLLHSLARTGFKSVILLAEDGTEHKAVLEDPVLLENPSISYSVLVGYMNAKMREDSLIVCRLPYACTDPTGGYDPKKRAMAFKDFLAAVADVPQFQKAKAMRLGEVRVAFSRSGDQRDPLMLGEGVRQKLTQPFRLKTLDLRPWPNVTFREIIGMCRLVAEVGGDSATVLIHYWI